MAKVSMWDPELGSFIRTLSELGENLKVGIPWIGRSLTSTTGDRCRTDQVEFHLSLKLLRQISHWESMPQTSAPLLSAETIIYGHTHCSETIFGGHKKGKGGGNSYPLKSPYALLIVVRSARVFQLS